MDLKQIKHSFEELKNHGRLDKRKFKEYVHSAVKKHSWDLSVATVEIIFVVNIEYLRNMIVHSLEELKLCLTSE